MLPFRMRKAGLGGAASIRKPGEMRRSEAFKFRAGSQHILMGLAMTFGPGVCDLKGSDGQR